MDLTKYTALQLSAAIRAGELSVPEVTRAALERSAADHNAYITRTPELAMTRAEQLQKNIKTAVSPLYGVPVALKDNICTRETPTTCASAMLRSFTPPYSATVAVLLEQGGTVCVGKTNLDEFAMGSTSETSAFGPVKNPLAPDHSPGGSSGGSAAAVAEGSCAFALGSDTGGSVRQPAAHCGLTGLKPTYGAVSRYGLVAYASSLEQIGPLCRDAADCAAVFDLIARPDGRDATCLPDASPPLLPRLHGDVRGLKIGLPEQCFAHGVEPQVARAVQNAAQVLQARGAAVEFCSLPLLAHAVSSYYIIACAEASSNLSRFDGVRYGLHPSGCTAPEQLFRASRTAGFGFEVKRRILLGTYALCEGYYDEYYRKALQARTALTSAFDDLFARYDLLLTPTAPATAPKLGESLDDPLQMYLSDAFTVPANLAGLPALSMPCGFDGAGLPIGAQLIAPARGELPLLCAAHAFQQDTDFHKRGWNG